MLKKDGIKKIIKIMLKNDLVMVMDGHIILYLETSILMKIKILLRLIKN